MSDSDKSCGASGQLVGAPLTAPSTIGACVTLSCIWEATAPKPGNVYRGADFEDVSYADFLTSAAVVGPVLEKAAEQGIGRTVLEAVGATRSAVDTNTNLGTVLLLTPLAAVPFEIPLAEGISAVLAELGIEDTQYVFEAIRFAQPGGLGHVDQANVQDAEVPSISLVEAMRLAAEYDLVARQFVNGFEQVFFIAGHLAAGVVRGWGLADAIVYGFLQLLAEHPDSLIRRKRGKAVAQQASTRAAAVLAQGEPGQNTYADAVAEFDFWLRGDGHQRNPGTSADFVAAGLFVLLREQRLNWPMKFYG